METTEGFDMAGFHTTDPPHTVGVFCASIAALAAEQVERAAAPAKSAAALPAQVQ
jgi:hypothetical protein